MSDYTCQHCENAFESSPIQVWEEVNCAVVHFTYRQGGVFLNAEGIRCWFDQLGLISFKGIIMCEIKSDNSSKSRSTSL